MPARGPLWAAKALKKEVVIFGGCEDDADDRNEHSRSTCSMALNAREFFILKPPVGVHIHVHIQEDLFASVYLRVPYLLLFMMDMMMMHRHRYRYECIVYLSLAKQTKAF